MELSTLRESCPNTKLFLVRILPHSDWVSLRIQSECGKIRTRKNFVFGHFSRSARIELPSVLLRSGQWFVHDKIFWESNFQNEIYNLNLQNITSATAGVVCEILRLIFLSRSTKDILVGVLEHKLDVGLVKRKNSRWGLVNFDP